MSFRAAFFAAALVVACAPRGTTNDAGTGLSTDEKSAYDGGAPSSNAAIALVEAADAMFQFDPTLDPTQGDTQNAQLVSGRILSQLGATADAGAKCGSVTLNGTTVTATFGAAPGCTLANGTKISGTIAVTITKTGTTIGIAMTMTTAVVNGQSLDGTVQFSTTNGSSFTLAGNFTSGATTYASSGVTITGAPGTVTIDGTLTITSDTASSYAFGALTWKQGDCYPNGGTLMIKTGLLSLTLAFDATTPTTGNVSVTVGKKTSTEKLPTYGSCT